MSKVLYKIRCPAHSEDTASCAVYEDGSGYCFGCSTYFSKLVDPIVDKTEQEKEDLPARIKYIESLDKVHHRGLYFPADSVGYYIVWPDKTYYKVRTWGASNKSRYYGAKGHTKPWFKIIPPKSTLDVAAIVEGEINALSLALAYPKLPIFSPGGVGNFVDSSAKSMFSYLTLFKNLYIIVDGDVPGVEAAIKCKTLLQSDAIVRIMLMNNDDLNDTLVNRGVKGIQDVYKITGTI